MDGQTLALTAPGLLQQAWFEYGLENDEEVYKESFITTAHGADPERYDTLSINRIERWYSPFVNVTARYLL